MTLHPRPPPLDEGSTAAGLRRQKAPPETEIANNDLTADEFKTLARFQSSRQPTDIDPHHFAKLLSLALLEQKEGGAELTDKAIEFVKHGRTSCPR
jgi:hypothetical protein